MKKAFFAAAGTAVFIMGALILGRSLQEILIVLLCVIFLWLKKIGSDFEDDGGKTV